MCGIFGIWHRDGRPADLEEVRAATASMRHRGPDDEGYLLAETASGRIELCGGTDTTAALGLPPLERFAGETFNLALGFRRLSILDLSPAGHQPMASPDRRHWIVFNGEIYNYVELRDELAGFGHDFQTGTDTEVLLAAYRQWGSDCLGRLNGMWAFAVFDSQERSVFLARDRFGVKPLFYRDDGATFSFGSEVKALVGPHGIPFLPDDEVVYRYLVGNLLPSPRRGETFFAGIRSLPPAHSLVVTKGRATAKRYWRLPATGSKDAQPDALVDRYRELFLDSVRLRLRSDVGVGTCLSGGVDSSSIVAAINRLMAAGGLDSRQIGERQRTFSAVYDTPGPFNEREHIERMVAATGVRESFTFPTRERLAQEMERLVWHQDEPFQSTSIFAQWCVMDLVRDRGVTVLLDGQGADEVLAGYRPFDVYLADMVRSRHLLRALSAASAAHRNTDIGRARTLGRALAFELPAPLLRMAWRRKSMRDMDQAILNPEFLAARPHGTIIDWLPSLVRNDLSAHLADQVEESSLPHLLRHEDRNSMAFSVEARVPFLDYRLVEFSFARAANVRIRDGWTKWVLRRAVEGMVPDEIAWRRDKVGFETPEDDWIRRLAREMPDLFADDAATSRYLDMKTVRARIAAWASAGGDVRLMWRWMNLEMWLRVWGRV